MKKQLRLSLIVLLCTKALYTYCFEQVIKQIWISNSVLLRAHLPYK